MREVLATGKDGLVRASRGRASNPSSFVTRIAVGVTGRKTSQVAYLCALAVAGCSATEDAAVDEEEAVWLATAYLRNQLGTGADDWQQSPGVEVRTMGWVVSFRHVGHFKPGDGPRPMSVYVFADRRAE